MIAVQYYPFLLDLVVTGTIAWPPLERCAALFVDTSQANTILLGCSLTKVSTLVRHSLL